MKIRVWLSPLLACIAFALLSLAILPYPGLRRTHSPDVNAYLGAFRTWLYAGIFEIFEPSRWSVRVPVILVGVITIWLTWLWTRRAAGPRAAAFTVALPATDSLFIATNTSTWARSHSSTRCSWADS